jgi:hypothetical protein
MSNARHGPKRGGISALRAASVLSLSNTESSFDPKLPSSTQISNSALLDSHSPPQNLDLALGASNVLDFAHHQPDNNSNTDNLDFPSLDADAHDELLQDAAFPEWRDDSGTGADTLETPEEMQQKDPLGTQIWKLYSRTKTRLPNQERMENLTWRMMAMNLRRREQQAACVWVLPSCELMLTRIADLQLKGHKKKLQRKRNSRTPSPCLTHTHREAAALLSL